MLSRFTRLAMIVALVATIAPGLLPAPARAATFSSGDIVLVNTNYLNIRTDAGTDGTVRDVLVNGQSLEVLDGPRDDDGFTWYKVGVDATGMVGWVAADFIAYSLGGGTGEGFDGALGVRVIDGPLNVRRSAGLDGAIVGTLTGGFEVPTYASNGQVVSADGYDWVRILFGNGIEGWAATDFLTPLDYSPNLGSDDGWSTAEGVEVVDGPVNRRATPGLDGAILDTLSTGFVSGTNTAEFTTADGYTWVPVYRLNSTTKWGWVAMDFLRPLAETPCIDGPCYPDEILPFLSATEAVVSDGPVNFRAEPDADSTILMTLEDGDYLFLDRADNQFPPSEDGYFWIAATVGGEFGYVALDFITALD